MEVGIHGGRILLGDGTVAEAPLAIRDGVIAEIGRCGNGRNWNGCGCLVLPGIIDIHGDAFEHLIMPRPNAMLPVDLAILQTDRQLVSNGITTAYYGMSHTWEPGLRGDEGARAFLRAFEETRPRLAVDSRLHLRFEIYHVDALDEAVKWVEGGKVDLLAFNDHISYQESRMDDPSALAEYAHRSGLSPEEFRRLFQTAKEHRGQALDGVRRLASVAGHAGIPMASHDEETPEVRAWYHGLGCFICEFPCNRETAAAARAMGDAVVLGGPNALKGESLYNRLSARRSISDGLCTVLSSDYYYASQLIAALLLVRLGIASLGQAWGLVSGNAAAALSLLDRGEIAPGKRADLILVDELHHPYPRVEATFVAGRLVYATGELLRNNT